MEIIDAEYQFDRNKLTFFFRLVISIGPSLVVIHNNNSLLFHVLFRCYLLLQLLLAACLYYPVFFDSMKCGVMKNVHSSSQSG